MPKADFWLTTDRLALRRATPYDFEWLADLWADPEVMRYVGGPHDRAQSQAHFEERFLAYYDKHPGLGVWITVDRFTSQPIGVHNLNHVHGESFIQVGFILAKSAWGRGIATEMAQALLRYGFVDLALPQIVALANVDNFASQRVLTKIGLRRNGERSFPHPQYASQGPMAWFERDATDWLAERT